MKLGTKCRWCNCLVILSIRTAGLCLISDPCVFNVFNVALKILRNRYNSYFQIKYLLIVLQPLDFVLTTPYRALIRRQSQRKADFAGIQ